MYTGTALEVVALDAVTGRQFWKISRSARSERILQRLRSEQGPGDCRGHRLLGHHRLPPAGARRQDRPGHLGQGDGEVAEGLPVQRGAAGRAQHGNPGARHQRGGRQLLGGGVRREDRKRDLALQHRAHFGRPAGGKDLDGRFLEARRRRPSGTAERTTRRRTSRSGAPGIRTRAGTAIRARRATTCTPIP